MPKYWSLITGLLAGALSFACQSVEHAPNAAAGTTQQAVNPPTNLADFHHDKKVFCSDCHAPPKLFPDDNESVENSACIRCHRSGSAPPTTNTAVISAHRSHLGKTNCTVCHHGHTASEVYCSNCHLFNMQIPFQGVPDWSLPNLHPDVKVTDTTDVVVIGSGGAGLTTAITASDLGASVIVLEKQPLTGGNTMLSAGGMNAANTRFQRALGITDSVQKMIDDTMLAGSGQNAPELVNLLATNSSDSVDWLTSLGVDLTDVGKLAGSSVKRSHRPSGGRAIGAHLIALLRSNTAQRPIVVRVNSKVTQIVTDAAGEVVGVQVLGKHSELYQIAAKAVVLAAGGFSANLPRVTQYHPEYAGMTSSNQPGALGEGMDLGAAVGGQLMDMDKIQIHPTLAAGSRILITEAVRGNGGAMVNRQGQRFVNEMATRSVVSAEVLKQTGKTAFVVFDQTVRNGLAQIEGYLKLGLVTQADTLEGLAVALAIPAGALRTTIDSYNQAYATESHEDPDFHRIIPAAIVASNFYAIEVGPGIHYTMGGLKIDLQTRVVDASGTPIPGLFAAGEVTGGVHGWDRLGGNSISETITFGRIAGANAVARVKATEAGSGASN